MHGGHYRRDLDCDGDRHFVHVCDLQCGHNVLMAHTKAIEICRAKYQAPSESTIGITLNYEWGYPWNASDPAV